MTATPLVRALRGALPWLQLYQGKTFLVKLGGEAVDENLADLIDQVALLHCLGIKVVLVHGGGAQINRTSEALGLTVQKVDGRRVTDSDTLEVASMVLNGSVRTRLLAAFRKAGVKAVGVSGVDGGLIQAKRRAPVTDTAGKSVDYGMVGDVTDVNVDVLKTLLDQGYLPVVSPLCADDMGNVLNVNADVVAARIAGALEVEKLLLITGAPGLLADASDPDSLVVSTDLDGLDMLQATGAFKDGMLPKVACLRDALKGGVQRVHVVSHKAPDTLLQEVFTNEGSGTLVVAKLPNTEGIE